MKAEITERIRLINKGQVPEGYKKSKVGIIPNDWEEKELKEISIIKSGSTPLRSNEKFFKNGNIHWVKTTDLNNSFIVDTEEKVTNYALENTSLRINPIDSILIAMYGGFNQIGRTGILKVEAATNQALSVLNINKDVVFPYFSLHWLNLKVDLWKNFAGSSRKDPNITSSDVAKFPIIYPKLPEQQKIASILSTWDKAIELKEKLILEKKKQKIALMQELLTGKKRVDGFDENIKQTKLKGYIKEISIKNRDNQVSRILSVTNNRGFIEQSEQFDRQIASSNLTTYKIVRRNQFGYNPSRINVGSVDLLTNYNEGLLSPIYVIFETIKESLISDYMFQFIKSPNFNNQMKALLQGSVRDNLSFDALSEMKLFIPSIPEQTAISNILSLADKEISLLEKELQALKVQKKGLMQLLLTGIVRVN